MRLNDLFRRSHNKNSHLFAQVHVKMVSFFSRPWHPYAFHLFKSKFLGRYWSDSSNFWINTTTGQRSIIFWNFSRWIFWRVISEKNSFFGFFRGQRVFFESCLYSKLGNANVFELIIGTQFSWAASCNIFFPKKLTSFREKKGWIFLSFSKQIRHPFCPLCFLIFTLILYKHNCRICLFIA